MKGLIKALFLIALVFAAAFAGNAIRVYLDKKHQEKEQSKLEIEGQFREMDSISTLVIRDLREMTEAVRRFRKDTELILEENKKIDSLLKVK